VWEMMRELSYPAPSSFFVWFNPEGPRPAGKQTFDGEGEVGHHLALFFSRRESRQANPHTHTSPLVMGILRSFPLCTDSD
jgi:hypothetical protein